LGGLFLLLLPHLRQCLAGYSPSLYRLSVAKEVGSDGSAAGGGVKRPERVAAVGVQRSRVDGKAHTGHRNSTTDRQR